MQDKLFKVKNFEVTYKSVKIFSLEMFRLYGYYGTQPQFYNYVPTSHIMAVTELLYPLITPHKIQ